MCNYTISTPNLENSVTHIPSYNLHHTDWNYRHTRTHKHKDYYYTIFTRCIIGYTYIHIHHHYMWTVCQNWNPSHIKLHQPNTGTKQHQEIKHQHPTWRCLQRYSARREWLELHSVTGRSAPPCCDRFPPLTLAHWPWHNQGRSLRWTQYSRPLVMLVEKLIDHDLQSTQTTTKNQGSESTSTHVHYTHTNAHMHAHNLVPSVECWQGTLYSCKSTIYICNVRKRDFWFMYRHVAYHCHTVFFLYIFVAPVHPAPTYVHSSCDAHCGLCT